MLYPELSFEPSPLTSPPEASDPRTAGGRQLAVGQAGPAWLEPSGARVLPRRPLRGLWVPVATHPTEERVCVALGEVLYELDLEKRLTSRLPFPPGASAQYVGADGLAVLAGDELSLYEHAFGKPPRLLDVVKGTYPGRLVAAADDVVVLAGDEAPCAFFWRGGDRLCVVGEIDPATLRVFECFVHEGRVHLYGRGGGTENEVVVPVLIPPDDPPPPELAELFFEESWDAVLELPPAAARWTGSRDYQTLIAGALGPAGVCLVAAAPPDALDTTLALWFRDGFRNVSVFAIPDALIDAQARAALDALDGRDDADADAILASVQPFWDHIAGEVLEESQAPPVRIAARITHVVRLRSA